MKKPRIIFHIDLNAFFASVEMILDPYLKNKVFAVGGSSYFKGGIITTASYKARKYGIHSAMTVKEAYERYPKLIMVPNKHNEYGKYSRMFIDVLKTYTEEIYQASIDEAYIDVTNIIDVANPLKLAKDIQNKLLKIKLPCSIGIGPTLFLAKMASDFKKPLGITILRKREIKKMLYPLDIGKIHGIGKKTSAKLQEINIKTVKDFMDLNNKEKIIEAIGNNSYLSYKADLTGNSSSLVDPEKYLIPKSVSSETTLTNYIDHVDIVKQELDILFNECYKRLIDEDLLTKSVFIKFRTDQFKTMTKTKSLVEETNDINILENAYDELFYEFYQGETLRLLGVGFANIVHKKDFQVIRNLFNYKEVDKLVD